MNAANLSYSMDQTTRYHRQQQHWINRVQVEKNYAKRHGMRLIHDIQAGFWLQYDLHYNGQQRYIPFIEDVRGWIDYLR